MSFESRLRSWFRRDGGGGHEYAQGHSPNDVRKAREGPVKKGRTRSPIAKQEPDRKNTLPADLARQIQARNGAMKPYDPHWLKDLSKNWVAQAYIDTMAQDAATAPWTLQARDDGDDLEEDQIREAERTLQSLHPEKSFRDLREMAARNTLRMGDGAWIKHYYSDGELAEVVPADTARIYKKVDEHGLTTGYVQVSFSNRETGVEFGLEEIVWFEWSSREDHVYGEGPVEKGEELIRLIEELKEKEVKDLEEGMPPGIVSVKEDEDTPLAVDSYETVKDEWNLKEGERHRAIVSMGDWQFTPLDAGYQELQFMQRNKMWIQSLGAVFKVNAPYAGFDFQEGNKAQNEAQHEAAKQRGFNVLLRQMEEAINRQLIWPDISEDLEFTFESAKSVEEQQAEAAYQQELAAAAEEWDKLGRDVTLRDGRLDIEDGPVEAPDEPAGDEGGGPFGFSAAKDDAAHVNDEGRLLCRQSGGVYQPDLVEANDEVCPGCGAEVNVVEVMTSDREANDDEDDAAKALTKAEVRKLDGLLLEAHRTQVQPDSIEDIDKAAWNGDESVPEYVVERIRSAIEDGAVFQDIDGIPERTVERLEDMMADTFTQPQGWSLDSLVDRMQDTWPGVDEQKLETVARTETTSVLNQAREEGYEDAAVENNPRFYWTGPEDSRTTPVCTGDGDTEPGLKERTHPDYGGTPVTMPELVRMQEELHNQFHPELRFRKHVPHINCRHTFVRHVDDSF